MAKEISSTSRAFILEITDEIRNGFIGDIHIHCPPGGIGEVYFNRKVTSKDLPKRAAMRREEERRGRKG